MKTATKIVFAGLLLTMMLGGIVLNFALTAPGSSPSSTPGCVKQPDGTWVSNGRVCDRVDYTIFKKGMVAYIDPYFYQLVAEGWTFVNMSRGGSFFTFETHNLLTSAGVLYIQNQLHVASAGTNPSAGAAFTTFTVGTVGLSYSSTSPAATDASTVGQQPSAGPCQDNNLGEITVLGLTRTTFSTVTPGSTSSGSVSFVGSKTWTAYGTLSNVQAGCAWAANNAATTSTFGSGTLYAENTFSSVNLSSGDQITITWTFTYSG
jgi:hypothetical protein